METGRRCHSTSAVNLGRREVSPIPSPIVTPARLGLCYKVQMLERPPICPKCGKLNPKLLEGYHCVDLCWCVELEERKVSDRRGRTRYTPGHDFEIYKRISDWLRTIDIPKSSFGNQNAIAKALMAMAPDDFDKS